MDNPSTNSIHLHDFDPVPNPHDTDQVCRAPDFHPKLNYLGAFELHYI